MTPHLANTRVHRRHPGQTRCGPGLGPDVVQVAGGAGHRPPAGRTALGRAGHSRSHPAWSATASVSAGGIQLLAFEHGRGGPRQGRGGGSGTAQSSGQPVRGRGEDGGHPLLRGAVPPGVLLVVRRLDLEMGRELCQGVGAVGGQQDPGVRPVDPPGRAGDRGTDRGLGGDLVGRPPDTLGGVQGGCPSRRRSAGRARRPRSDRASAPPPTRSVTAAVPARIFVRGVLIGGFRRGGGWWLP